jgi:hypothetical protein
VSMFRSDMPSLGRAITLLFVICLQHAHVQVNGFVSQSTTHTCALRLDSKVGTEQQIMQLPGMGPRVLCFYSTPANTSTQLVPQTCIAAALLRTS